MAVRVESAAHPRRRRRWWLWVLVAPLTFIACGCPLSYFVYQRWTHHEGIRTACVWARLAPLPVEERNVDVDVRGSPFTREFVVSFTSDAATIQTWLAASPGTAAAKIENIGHSRKFLITPGGGAEYADVEVDDSTGRVTIRTYWS